MKVIKSMEKGALVILIPALIAVLFTSYSWSSSISEVKEICEHVQSEKHKIDAVQTMVASSRYAKIDAPSERNDPPSFVIHSPISMGRGLCQLGVKDGVVVFSNYYPTVK